MNRVSPRTKPKNLKIKENKTKTVTIYKEKRKKKDIYKRFKIDKLLFI